jgi:hypothetical protein
MITIQTKKGREIVLKTDDGSNIILLVADFSVPLPLQSILFTGYTRLTRVEEKNKWRWFGGVTVRLMTNSSVIDWYIGGFPPGYCRYLHFGFNYKFSEELIAFFP